MEPKNSIFIGVSIDGYIADRDGSLAWLETVPNPAGNDMGYGKFMARIDALVMGRKTYETILGFGIDWPYPCPVYVLSTSLSSLPPELAGKVFLEQGPLTEVVARIHEQGYQRLYIDGGKVIQSFLEQELIDELTLTTIPVLLGGGVRLFGNLNRPQRFHLAETEVFLGEIVQRRYVNKA